MLECIETKVTEAYLRFVFLIVAVLSYRPT